jgi:hypothetical protein
MDIDNVSDDITVIASENSIPPKLPFDGDILAINHVDQALSQNIAKHLKPDQVKNLINLVLNEFPRIEDEKLFHSENYYKQVLVENDPAMKCKGESHAHTEVLGFGLLGVFGEYIRRYRVKVAAAFATPCFQQQLAYVDSKIPVNAVSIRLFLLNVFKVAIICQLLQSLQCCLQQTCCWIRRRR